MRHSSISGIARYAARFAGLLPYVGGQVARTSGAAGRSGFSLLEVMVVVATLSLLISLLLPSLNDVKESARRTKCASNQHQLGIASHIFATDHNNVLPPLVQEGDSTETITYKWFKFMYGRLVEQNYCTTFEVFYCPSANTHTYDGPHGPLIVPEPMFIRSSYFQRGTAQNPLGVDQRFLVGEPSLAIIADYELPADEVFNHRKGVNALFTDGHVQFARGSFNASDRDGFGGDTTPGACDGMWCLIDGIR